MAEEPAEKVQPESEPEQPDYSSESAEELEQRLMSGEGLVIERVDEPEPAPEAAPPEPKEGSEGVEAKQEEPPAEKPQSTEGTDVENVFDVDKSYREEAALQLEKAQAEARKWEVLQQRDSGKVGALQQKLERLEALLQQASQPQEPVYDAEPQAVPQRPVATGDPALQSRLAALETVARSEAIEAEYTAFLKAKGVPDQDAPGVFQKMAASVREQWEPYKGEAHNMSPDSLRKVLRVVLDSSFADLRLNELREARKAALERKASQVPERKKAKLAASVSGSSGTSPSKPQIKSPEDMTAEEADRELRKLYGDGIYRRGLQR